MNHSTLTKGVAATIAAGILSVGLIVPSLAQDNGIDTTEEATTEESRPHAARHAQREATYAAALAEELGLDTDTVAEAISTVNEALRVERKAERLAQIKERLTAVVEAGHLTQEQADAALAAHEAGVMGFGHDGRGHRPGRMWAP